MKVGPDQLQAHLASQLAPLYLIAGDAPLLVAEATDALRRVAAERGFTDRSVHTVERGFDWHALNADARNLSLFAEQRMIELRLPTGKPGTDGAKALTALAEDPGDGVLWLIVCGEMDNKTTKAKWVRTLEQAGVFVHVRNVPTGRLPQWVQQRMRSRGLQPSGNAARIIAERCEGNLLAADQEIEKLLLANGPGTVDETTVMQSVTDSARYDVFQLSDAAMVGDVPRAIHMLDGLLAEGVAAPLILWALDRELRMLARLSWLMQHGARAEDAMTRARVWSSRRPLVRRALERHRDPSAFAAMLEQAARTDQVAKGVQFGDAHAELTRLVGMLAGAALPAPIEDVA
ncbi:MAG: DNA polymerase III subunit delta [Gammaproteobacteria bacterium]|nr:DNA polymerase III subunit delta [Gammaproteobacteria bacterium]NND58919.1 DNA polymerase III subunit delta [Gammaproteobacteria bacterium]